MPPPRVPHGCLALGCLATGTPELLQATISSTSRSEPDLVIMRMIKRLFKLLRMMIITIYDEISAITKYVEGGGVGAKGGLCIAKGGRFIAVPYS